MPLQMGRVGTKKIQDIHVRPRPRRQRQHAQPSVRQLFGPQPVVITDKLIDPEVFNDRRRSRRSKRWRRILVMAVTIILVLGIGFVLRYPSNGGPYGLWDAGAKPQTLAAQEDRGIELGLQFKPSADGQIEGVRFYKSPQNTGIHSGSLWTQRGGLLATAIPIEETSSGWQEVIFLQPVPVQANTTYVASYHAAHGHYSVDHGYFAMAGRSKNKLAAAQAGDQHPTSVYAFSNAIIFPNKSGDGNNFWVDVLFTPANQ
jgi:hypothetical protein